MDDWTLLLGVLFWFLENIQTLLLGVLFWFLENMRTDVRTLDRYVKYSCHGTNIMKGRVITTK